MKLHLLALPHTQVSEQYLSCAYTQKVAKFCKMMGHDYEIVLYAGEDVSGTSGYADHVVCVHEDERAGWFGRSFDTVRSPLKWDASEPYWQCFAERAIPALRERASKGDLCLLTTSVQKPIADAVPDVVPVEWAVGYEGIGTNFCAFESFTWMHHVYGLRGWRHGRAFDAAIPNFFDVDDFVPPAKPRAGREYLLYLGRVTESKGPHIASEIAKRLGMKLLVAGPGADQDALGPVRGEGCVIEGDVRYLGEVGKATRAELLANASALLVPTLYVEPFGGVAVEAMMSGCPVVASDWGAFTETVTPDVGARFRTLKQGVEAVQWAMALDRGTVAAKAQARYCLETVGRKFRAWFDQLETLQGAGWYA
jgi:hypothetical protein